jgi:hypothetical protein
VSPGQRPQGRRATRAALACVLVALGLGGGALAGCGGSDQASQVEPVTAPPLTVPGEETFTDTTPESTTETSTTDGGQAPEPSGGTPTPTPTPAPAQPNPGQSGGAASPDNNAGAQPAPKGSPAGRFEDFCNQNPGAC